jgi:uncharacterized protein YbaR (Trm112 family)
MKQTMKPTKTLDIRMWAEGMGAWFEAAWGDGVDVATWTKGDIYEVRYGPEVGEMTRAGFITVEEQQFGVVTDHHVATCSCMSSAVARLRSVTTCPKCETKKGQASIKYVMEKYRTNHVYCPDCGNRYQLDDVFSERKAERLQRTWSEERK